MSTHTGRALARVEGEEQRKPLPLPLYNGVISPDKWTTLGRMAVAFADTEFVPKGLRGRPDAVLACLVYGDSFGLHPSAALKEVYIVDGRPGISGALMAAMIRRAGHKVEWTEVRSDKLQETELKDGFVGWTCTGTRIEDGEVVAVDSWTYTMADARRAMLYPHSNSKAAWMTVPKVMCRWRALAQVARFLFPDVFAGQAVYLPEEVEVIAHEKKLVNGGPVQQEGERDGDGADYGDDPALAGWLIALFAAANHVEEGVWLPKRVKLALKGRTQDEREQLAEEIAEWLRARDFPPPERPTDEVEETEAEVLLDVTGAEPEPEPEQGSEPEPEHEPEDEPEQGKIVVD